MCCATLNAQGFQRGNSGGMTIKVPSRWKAHNNPIRKARRIPMPMGSPYTNAINYPTIHPKVGSEFTVKGKAMQ